MNLFPFTSNKTLDAALERVYGDNLRSLLTVANDLSAQDVADLETIIALENGKIDEANAILERIIARHAAVRDQRVGDASAVIAVSSERLGRAKQLLNATRNWLKL